MPSHHDYGIDCEHFCGGTPDDIREPMHPADFAAEMRRIAAMSGKEARHSQADALLREVLGSMGYGDGVAVYLDVEKWCA